MEYNEIVKVLQERLGPAEARDIIEGIEVLYQKNQEAERRCGVLEGNLAEEKKASAKLKDEIAYLRQNWEPKRQGGRRGMPWEEK